MRVQHLTIAVGLVSGFAWAGLGAGQPTHAEPVDPTDISVRCPTDLATHEAASQLMLAVVSEPVDVSESAGRREVGGMVPVGDFVERLGEPGGDPWVALDDGGGNPPWLFASDEEGGVVQRFEVLYESIPSARRQVEQFTPERVEEIFAEYGGVLDSIGVSMAFAPVVDVGGGPAIGDRSYGTDPAVVIEYAGAVIDGYQQAGITPVLKHFPGHGRASADTHDGPAVTPPLDELRQLDLVPFEALLDRDVAVMVGHLDVPGLTDGIPASLSPAAIDGLLRDEMGFDGLVVSDALGMGAIRQFASPEDAVVMFLQAGGDLALVDQADVDTSRSAIVAAADSGRLEPLRLHHAVERVLDVKGVAGNCAAPWTLYAQAAGRQAFGATD